MLKITMIIQFFQIALQYKKRSELARPIPFDSYKSHYRTTIANEETSDDFQ